MKLLCNVCCFLLNILWFSLSQAQELDEGEDGNFMFFSDNNEMGENAYLFGRDKVVSRQDCEDSVLSSHLTSIQVINPESVIALSTKNKLENKCHNISKTISHMDSYMKSCNLVPGQDEYVHLFDAVKALHKKLCTRDTYHKSFMEHKKCYGKLQTEVGDSCNGPTDWSESSNSQRVCRAYQEIRDCYYLKTSVMCGEKAAEIFNELVQCIIESVITVNCTVGVSEESSLGMSKVQAQMLQSQLPSSSQIHHVSKLSLVMLTASFLVKFTT
ncbi:uncharacterized protein LOC128991050 [Macrosteles quadrilineatus]|uniref:uncharacterized protein LOC128991050 n=1 Tax=Macrosteles quadrilineatus TaxID=74068 RepID=UPI0023E25FCC|nr:uncharacterized protein LOC128991050 [Macrosteles quadrilineatus]